MAKLSLNTIGSRYGSIDALNDNFDAIEAAIENTLSLDGTSPNEMEADLDLNGHDLLNVGEVNTASLRLNGVAVSPSTITYNGVVKETQVATSGQTVFNLSTISYSPLTNNMSVYVDGVYQNPSRYTETSSTRVTFSTGLHVGAVVDFAVLSLNTLGGATDSANVTHTQAIAGAVATTVKAKLSEHVSVKDFGAVGDGVTDDTTAIQAAINAVSGTRVEVVFPTGVYNITGITLPSRTILRGPGQLNLTGAGNTAITMDGTLYSTIYDLYIKIFDSNQKGISLVKTGSDYSQLNTFYNVVIEGQISTGTVGVEINNSFTNSFFGCQIIRTATQVTFSNGANANHFYGGELRSNNTNANGSYALIHNSGCSGNGFHGTVIENQRQPIQMNGGTLTIDSGCYIEGFYSAASIEMNGGSLVVNSNYLNNGFILINDGESISINDNAFDGTLSNANYPFIQYVADVATRLNCKGNTVKNIAGVLLRPRQWVSSSVWAYRSIQNRIEFVENKPVRFQARLDADLTNVTGDGTAYTVDFGSNQQFDDGSNVDTNGIFTAPENGIYNLSTLLWLSGLSTVDHTNITIRIVTSNRFYQITNQLTDGLTTAGRRTFGGSALVDMEAGDTATISVTVDGTNKSVDILRGDATNGYTMFTGYKVA